jgi:hypothetical protein
VVPDQTSQCAKSLFRPQLRQPLPMNSRLFRFASDTAEEHFNAEQVRVIRIFRLHLPDPHSGLIRVSGHKQMCGCIYGDIHRGKLTAAVNQLKRCMAAAGIRQDCENACHLAALIERNLFAQKWDDIRFTA